MAHKFYVLSCLLCLFCGLKTIAQRPFSEGTITYKVTIQGLQSNKIADEGTYTFTFKGDQLKKELRLNSGFQDIIIFDFAKNTVYSLRVAGTKKYAIQLNIDDILNDQRKYENFSLDKTEGNKKIAGLSASKAIISYTESSITSFTLYYTNDWYVNQPVGFERFPKAKFLPLSFTYTTNNGMIMTFEATQITPQPVENAVFRIPTDYKIISHAEYMQLNK